MMTRPFVNCTTLGCAARIDVPRAALPKCYLAWYYLWASSDGETTEKAMRGRPTKRVLTLIRELEAEGLL